MNKLLVLGCLAVVALALTPSATAAVFAEVDGKWYWRTEGYVRLISGTGAPARALVFLDDNGDYFFRVTFDPAARSFVQCANGEGFASLNGATTPLSSCSLALQGSTAIPRAVLENYVEQLPGPLGDYLGPMGLGLSGSGAFSIA